MAGLIVNIGGNAAQLSKTLGELKVDLKAFQDELANATDTSTVVRLNQAIANTQQQIKSISGAQNIAAIGAATKQLPAGFNAAGFAVGNFGRVVQDAPFALLQGNLIAISNNIDPLFQSFVQLSQQSGGVKGAFTALASSLAGPGGLLLAVSLVTAAITFFSATASQAKKESEGFFKAQQEANKTAAGDLTRLQLLNEIATDTARGMKERKDAATELVNQLKSLNVETTSQAVIEGNATKEIKKGTAAILERAEARAIENRITELRGTTLSNDIKAADATDKLTAAQKNLNDVLATRPKRETPIAGTPSNIESDPLILLAKQPVINLQNELKGLQEESKKANDEIGKLFAKFKEDKVTPEFNLPKPPKLKPIIVEVDLKSSKIITAKDFINLPTELIVPLRLGASDKMKVDISDFARTAEQELANSKISDALGLDKLPEDFAGATAVLNDFAKTAQGLKDKSIFDQLISEGVKVQDFLTGELGPAFTDLFTSIASGGENALEAFGNAIKGVITKLAAAAVTAAIFAAIIGVATGGTSFGGGGTSFLSGFKSMFSGLGGFKFASGGIATSSVFGNVAENQPEAILPLSRLPQIVNQINTNSTNGGASEVMVLDLQGNFLFTLKKAQDRQDRIH